MEKGQQLRVAVLSATLGTLDASGLGRDEALARIDHNTGNLAFQHAVGLHVAQILIGFGFIVFLTYPAVINVLAF